MTPQNRALLAIATREGRLANRVTFFARFIGFSCATGFPVVNLAFGDYAKYFKSTANNSLCYFPETEDIWNSAALQNMLGIYKIFLHAVNKQKRAPVENMEKRISELSLRSLNAMCDSGTRQLLLDFSTFMVDGIQMWQFDPSAVQVKSVGNVEFNMEDPAFRNELEKSPAVWFMSGWGLLADKARFEHAPTIRKFFEPLDIYTEGARRIFAEAKRRGDVVVGVHIRQGDYRDWLKGRYFYPTSEYARIVNGIDQQLTSLGKKGIFIICADEERREDLFKPAQVMMGEREPMEDLTLLSLCDFIIGAPSTFSGWAAYYGNKPLHAIEKPGEMPRVESLLSNGKFC